MRIRNALGLLCILSIRALGQAGFDDLDGTVRSLMSTYGIPGVSVAIARDGRLLLARGYGVADQDTGEAFEPTALSRWASISKTVTGAGILKLVEQGKLNLDARVFDILGRVQPYNGRWGDSRSGGITVRQLLRHTGGWDRSQSGDPVLPQIRQRAAASVGGPFLPSAETLTRYMLAQPLDFAPGTRFAYSNLGFMILGLIIEEVSGQPYEEFIRRNVFDPIGVLDVRRGGSVLEERAPGEVRYHDTPNAPLMASTLVPFYALVATPYGLTDIYNGFPAGGWIGSAIHLLKLVSSLDGQRQPAVLRPTSMGEMIAPPESRLLWADFRTYYGLGMAVQEFPGLGVWTHSGANPGSRSTYVRFSTGFSYALLANGEGTNGEQFRSALAESLSAICLSGRSWPDHDLFLEYFPPRVAPGGVVSAAGFRSGPVAPDSLVTVFGSDLAGNAEGFSAGIRDRDGAEHALPILYASLAQVNLRIPAGVAPGPAALLIRRDPHAEVSTAIEIARVAPGIFTANADGLPAALITRVRADGSQAIETVTGPLPPAGPGEQLWLSLYVTGVRGGSAVNVLLDHRPVSAAWFGAHSIYAGVDQVNVPMPRDLIGRVQLSIVVDGVMGNTVCLDFE